MSRFAVLTVMRDEWELVELMARTLSWCDEWHVVVTDDQGEHADELGRLREGFAGVIHVHHHPLPLGGSFDAARGAALSQIRAEWVVVLDTDERLGNAAVDQIEKLMGDSHDVAGFWLPRLNHVLGRPLRSNASWPDWQLRIVRRDAVVFPDGIHNKYLVEGMAAFAPEEEFYAIHHFPFRSNSQFLKKLDVYTTIEANVENSKPAQPTRAFALAAKYFIVRFVKQKGFLDGEFGLHNALCWSFYRYMAHVKAWERAQDFEPFPKEGDE